MFHAILEMCVQQSGRDDIERFKALVEQLKGAKSEAEAIDNVLFKAIGALTLPVTEAITTRLRGMADLLCRPQYASVYRPFAIYRETDERTAGRVVTVYDSFFKNEQSAAGDPKQIAWDNVSRLKKAYIDAFKANGFSVAPLDIMIDVPFGKNSMRHIEWYDDTERRDQRFESHTHFGKAFFDKPAAHWSPVRIYVSPELLREVRPENAIAVRSFAESKYLPSSEE